MFPGSATQCARAGRAGTNFAIATLTRTTARLAISSGQGPVPGDFPQLNLAPGGGRSRRRGEVKTIETRIGLPHQLVGLFSPAMRAEFSRNRGGQPWLILAQLSPAYNRAGGVLYAKLHPHDHHSLTLPSAGVGPIFCVDAVRDRICPGARADRLILLMGIVQENAIMMSTSRCRRARHQHCGDDASCRPAFLRFFARSFMTTWPPCSARCRWRWKAAPAAELSFVSTGHLDLGGLLLSQF